MPMINNENTMRSMLFCIEEIESNAKIISENFDQLALATFSDDMMRYYVENINKCAKDIIVKLNFIHFDRVGIESALPEEDDLTQPGVRPFSGKSRDSGFNGAGEDDSQMERFLEEAV